MSCVTKKFQTIVVTVVTVFAFYITNFFCKLVDLKNQ